jgi:hypothetical protein
MSRRYNGVCFPLFAYFAAEGWFLCNIQAS